ncbi:MAG: hypothetical protein ACYTXY_23120 [Nostoc sp.]
MPYTPTLSRPKPLYLTDLAPIKRAIRGYTELKRRYRAKILAIAWMLSSL